MDVWRAGWGFGLSWGSRHGPPAPPKVCVLCQHNSSTWGERAVLLLMLFWPQSWGAARRGAVRITEHTSTMAHMWTFSPPPATAPLPARAHRRNAAASPACGRPSASHRHRAALPLVPHHPCEAHPGVRPCHHQRSSRGVAARSAVGAAPPGQEEEQRTAAAGVAALGQDGGAVDDGDDGSTLVGLLEWLVANGEPRNSWAATTTHASTPGFGHCLRRVKRWQQCHNQLHGRSLSVRVLVPSATPSMARRSTRFTLFLPTRYAHTAEQLPM